MFCSLLWSYNNGSEFDSLARSERDFESRGVWRWGALSIERKLKDIYILGIIEQGRSRGAAGALSHSPLFRLWIAIMTLFGFLTVQLFLRKLMIYKPLCVRDFRKISDFIFFFWKTHFKNGGALRSIWKQCFSRFWILPPTADFRILTMLIFMHVQKVSKHWKNSKKS